ncbi:MAG: hypothetical protein ISS91_02735 [Candidatus Omnitrophica bacterium]|nr:hypothetical protein [Candidatus Omnitrophota bacterium]
MGITKNTHIAFILKSSRTEAEIKTLIKALRGLGITEGAHITPILQSFRTELEIKSLIATLKGLGITEATYIARILGTSRKQPEIKTLIKALRGLGITKDTHIAFILKSSRTQDEINRLVELKRTIMREKGKDYPEHFIKSMLRGFAFTDNPAGLLDKILSIDFDAVKLEIEQMPVNTTRYEFERKYGRTAAWILRFFGRDFRSLRAVIRGYAKELLLLDIIPEAENIIAGSGNVEAEVDKAFLREGLGIAIKMLKAGEQELINMFLDGHTEGEILARCPGISSAQVFGKLREIITVNRDPESSYMFGVDASNPFETSGLAQPGEPEPATLSLAEMKARDLSPKNYFKGMMDWSGSEDRIAGRGISDPYSKETALRAKEIFGPRVVKDELDTNYDFQQYVENFRRSCMPGKEEIVPEQKRRWAPVGIVLVPTLRCGNKCPMCYVDADATPGRDMPIDDMEKVFDPENQFDKNKNWHLSGGEIALRKDLFEIIRRFPVTSFTTSACTMKSPEYARKFVRKVKKAFEVRNKKTPSRNKFMITISLDDIHLSGNAISAQKIVNLMEAVFSEFPECELTFIMLKDLWEKKAFPALRDELDKRNIIIYKDRKRFVLVMEGGREIEVRFNENPVGRLGRALKEMPEEKFHYKMMSNIVMLYTRLDIDYRGNVSVTDYFLSGHSPLVFGNAVTEGWGTIAERASRDPLFRAFTEGDTDIILDMAEEYDPGITEEIKDGKPGSLSVLFYWLFSNPERKLYINYRLTDYYYEEGLFKGVKPFEGMNEEDLRKMVQEEVNGLRQEFTAGQSSQSNLVRNARLREPRGSEMDEGSVREEWREAWEAADKGKNIALFIQKIERRFFEALKEAGIKNMGLQKCVITTKLLAEFLSWHLNLPLGGKSPCRVEIVPGHYLPDGRHHRWIAVYTGQDEPTLLIDPSYWQFDSIHAGKILVGNYAELIDKLKLSEYREELEREIESLVASGVIRMSANEYIASLCGRLLHILKNSMNPYADKELVLYLNGILSELLRRGDISVVLSKSTEIKIKRALNILKRCMPKRTRRLNDPLRASFDEFLRTTGRLLSSEYSEDYGTLYRTPPAVLNALMKKFKIGPGVRVLDVGTGYGLAALRLGRTQANIVSIEHDPERVKLAGNFRTFLETKAGLSRTNVRYEEADFFKFPIRGFDVIYFYFTASRGVGREKITRDIVDKLDRELEPGQVFVSTSFADNSTACKNVIDEYRRSGRKRLKFREITLAGHRVVAISVRGKSISKKIFEAWRRRTLVEKKLRRIAKANEGIITMPNGFPSLSNTREVTFSLEEALEELKINHIHRWTDGSLYWFGGKQNDLPFAGDSGHSGNIGKAYEIINILKNPARYRMLLSLVDRKTKKRKRLTLKMDQRKRMLKNFIPGILSAAKKNKQVVARLLDLCPDIELRAYVNPHKDLFGFSWAARNIIALAKHLVDEPVAVFHEICEYLMQTGDLKIALKKGGLTVETNGRRTKIDVAKVLKLLKKEGESWSGWSDRTLNKPCNAHYLLRILQRKVFGEEDFRLTKYIQGFQKIDVARYNLILQGIATLKIIIWKTFLLDAMGCLPTAYKISAHAGIETTRVYGMIKRIGWANARKLGVVDEKTLIKTRFDSLEKSVAWLDENMPEKDITFPLICKVMKDLGFEDIRPASLNVWFTEQKTKRARALRDSILYSLERRFASKCGMTVKEARRFADRECRRKTGLSIKKFGLSQKLQSHLRTLLVAIDRQKSIGEKTTPSILAGVTEISKEVIWALAERIERKSPGTAKKLEIQIQKKHSSEVHKKNVRKALDNIQENMPRARITVPLLSHTMKNMGLEDVSVRALYYWLETPAGKPFLEEMGKAMKACKPDVQNTIDELCTPKTDRISCDKIKGISNKYNREDLLSVISALKEKAEALDERARRLCRKNPEKSGEAHNNAGLIYGRLLLLLQDSGIDPGLESKIRKNVYERYGSTSRAENPPAPELRREQTKTFEIRYSKLFEGIEEEDDIEKALAMLKRAISIIEDDILNYPQTACSGLIRLSEILDDLEEQIELQPIEESELTGEELMEEDESGYSEEIFPENPYQRMSKLRLSIEDLINSIDSQDVLERDWPPFTGDSIPEADERAEAMRGEASSDARVPTDEGLPAGKEATKGRKDGTKEDVAQRNAPSVTTISVYRNRISGKSAEPVKMQIFSIKDIKSNPRISQDILESIERWDSDYLKMVETGLVHPNTIRLLKDILTDGLLSKVYDHPRRFIYLAVSAPEVNGTAGYDMEGFISVFHEEEITRITNQEIKPENRHTAAGERRFIGVGSELLWDVIRRKLDTLTGHLEFSFGIDAQEAMSGEGLERNRPYGKDELLQLLAVHDNGMKEETQTDPAGTSGSKSKGILGNCGGFAARLNKDKTGPTSGLDSKDTGSKGGDEAVVADVHLFTQRDRGDMIDRHFSNQSDNPPLGVNDGTYMVSMNTYVSGDDGTTLRTLVISEVARGFMAQEITLGSVSEAIAVKVIRDKGLCDFLRELKVNKGRPDAKWETEIIRFVQDSIKKAQVRIVSAHQKEPAAGSTRGALPADNTGVQSGSGDTPEIADRSVPNCLEREARLVVEAGADSDALRRAISDQVNQVCSRHHDNTYAQLAALKQWAEETQPDDIASINEVPRGFAFRLTERHNSERLIASRPMYYTPQKGSGMKDKILSAIRMLNVHGKPMSARDIGNYAGYAKNTVTKFLSMNSLAKDVLNSALASWDQNIRRAVNILRENGVNVSIKVMAKVIKKEKKTVELTDLEALIKWRMHENAGLREFIHRAIKEDKENPNTPKPSILRGYATRANGLSSVKNKGIFGSKSGFAARLNKDKTGPTSGLDSKDTGSKGDVSLSPKALQDKGLGNDICQSGEPKELENDPSEVVGSKEVIAKRNVPLDTPVPGRRGEAGLARDGVILLEDDWPPFTGDSIPEADERARRMREVAGGNAEKSSEFITLHWGDPWDVMELLAEKGYRSPSMKPGSFRCATHVLGKRGPNLEAQSDSDMYDDFAQSEASRPTLPKELEKEWYEWLEALKALAEPLQKAFLDEARKLEKKVVQYDKTGQSIILDADDILEKVAVYDLQHAIKNILIKHKLLNGGKIVLFARKQENAKVLKIMIEETGFAVRDIVTIKESELPRNGDEIREVEKIIRLAKARGGREILGFIKGPAQEDNETELKEIAKSQDTPIVLFGYEKGIYSLAQALSSAIASKFAAERGQSCDWLIMLDPIPNPAENIKALYKEYRHRLKALRAA